MHLISSVKKYTEQIALNPCRKEYTGNIIALSAFMKLIILGGGFAGRKLACKFENEDGLDILLLDRYDYHQIQPLIY